MTPTGRDIAKIYDDAGYNFMAYRLKHLFTHIDSDEKRILHNDVWFEISQILNDTRPREGFLSRKEAEFLYEVMNWLVYQAPKPRKRFLFRMAEWICDKANVKG